MEEADLINNTNMAELLANTLDDHRHLIEEEIVDQEPQQEELDEEEQQQETLMDDDDEATKASSTPDNDENATALHSMSVDSSTRTKFAVNRIKSIMKMDPDLTLTSKESVFLVAKATELFIEFLTKESFKFTTQSNRKTFQGKDVFQAINAIDQLCFLDAALD